MKSLSFLVFVLLLLGRPVGAQDMVADLSDHFIAINTAFTGTHVVLFGAVNAQPTDIAVVVEGPPEDVEVWRKERTAGIWTNADSVEFLQVPSSYVVATTRPLPEFAEPPVLERHGIGLEYLGLQPAAETEASPAELAEFRHAIIRNRQREGVYGIEARRVSFLGPQLFRTDIDFPANLPTGRYNVSVFAFRDGAVISAQTTPLEVSQVGLSAGIVRFARQESAAYGLAAIVMAVAAGWAASAIFRRP